MKKSELVDKLEDYIAEMNWIDSPIDAEDILDIITTAGMKPPLRLVHSDEAASAELESSWEPEDE